MPDLTTMHDSRTCTLGPEGRACGMCEWASEVETEKAMTRKITLTYFKQTGKYYTGAECESSAEHAFEVYDEVREWNRTKRLPGLIEGHSDFITLVSIDGQPSTLIGLPTSSG